jgi:phenylalanyl-tRNA synthetase beta chain
MKISYRWLNQYLDLSNFKVEDIVSKITIAGVEVEGVKKLASGTNLVIGLVKETKKHPDSDHLSVCQVDIGGSVTQIVCGAKNVAANQKVIVALPGSYLPAKDLTIAKTSIRGQESNGMICSLKELGVADEYLTTAQKEGIEVLSNSAKVGDTNPLSFLGLDDIILELKPTPNRGDVYSLYSFALEVSAILDLPLLKKLGQIKLPPLSKSTYKVNTQTSFCPRFAIKGVSNIAIKPSPLWLVNLLQSSGIRSINNVVDIGNYVMLLTGQPLHIYDADKLAKKEFTVKDNQITKIVALDDKTYDVKAEDIVITSNTEVIGLAGIMGGKSTMVDSKTKNLAIESASFKDVMIRKTSRRLDLVSDASTRFVRGIDYTRSLYALDLAASLLVELADAKLIEETTFMGDHNLAIQAIELPTAKVNKFLGTTLTGQDLENVFKRLKFDYKVNKDGLIVHVPTYRRDIKIVNDLIEEVIRLIGFDKLKATNPASIALAGYDEYQVQRKLIRNYLINIGINEALSYTLESSREVGDFTLISTNKNIKIRKLLAPITEDREFLRASIIPSLLNAIHHNLNYSIKNVALFEASKLYLENGENEHLAIAITGALESTLWQKKPQVDFYTIKGIVVSLLEMFGIEESRYTIAPVEETNKYLHPGRSFYLQIGKQVFGIVGQIHPLMEKKYDINQTMVAELDLKYLLSIKTSKLKFANPPQYPSITRDVALVVDQKVLANDLVKHIKKVGKTIVKSAEVFDVYQGANLGENLKSVAISITYQDTSKTLSEDNVKMVHSEILSSLESVFKAKLRS